MTIQAGDILSYNGKKTTIATEPLKLIWKLEAM